LPFFVTMKRPALLLFLLLPSVLPGTEEAGYPHISRLVPQDVVFRQYLADVQAARRRLFTPEPGGEDPASLAESLTVYAYTPGPADDVFGLAARCNIPYAALATLNRLSHPVALENNGTLLLPSVPGIFIPEQPNSDLERILASARSGRGGIPLTLTRGGIRERFLFIPGADFTPTERAFFLHPAFSFPLRHYRISSNFGIRVSPISGRPRFHEGLDLAAPEGAEVYAARDGRVTETGEDPVFGKYIVLQHSENWVSLYGHLSAISVSLRDSLRSGTLIGRVGSTGLSTGPHLHFELRQNGKAQDPGKLLFKEGTR
jgi:murein DD-endopeptidase MepM/ murein hydrolase activator NlpD